MLEAFLIDHGSQKSMKVTVVWILNEFKFPTIIVEQVILN